MSSNEERILARFTDEAHPQPLFLPDLTLWYEWHEREKTLPAPSLEEVCRTLRVPQWRVVRPWSPETHRVEIRTETSPEEKLTTYNTPSGILRSRWIGGPDGDLWQAEYPVKGPDDLPAVLDIAADRSYRIASPVRGPGGQSRTEPRRTPGGGEFSVLDLPARPFSMLIYEFLGLSEGLMLLWDEPEMIGRILQALEESLNGLLPDFLKVPGSLVLSPDNLDSQFISPDNFQAYFLDSYSRTAEALHSAGMKLIVHAGGPVGSLLAGLAETGVDGIEGISGPPQGDTTLSAARGMAGPNLTLWGGIPQDLLLETHGEDKFEAGVRSACDEVRGKSRMILGVADRVPPQASLERLKAIPRLTQDVPG
jgi:hypothetical protein